MPCVRPERRLNAGGALNAYQDGLSDLYAAGIRAGVCLLNIPSDATVYNAAGLVFLCLPVPDGEAPTGEKATEFVRSIDGQRAKNHTVHCEGGIVGTGTMPAAYFISQGDTRRRR